MAAKETLNRPEFITDEHLEYLDDLRESGITNMYGAGSFLVDTFELNPKIAKAILTYWMKTFGNEDR